MSSWGTLGPLSGSSGAMLEPLGGSLLGSTISDNKDLIARTPWSHLGAMLGPSWHHVEPPWAIIWVIWGHARATWVSFSDPQHQTIKIVLSRLPGAILELFGVVLASL